MSADNGVYILITRDKMKSVGRGRWKNMKGTILAYRVAHCQAADNFEFYKERELHNLGHWMGYSFSHSRVYYEKAQAMADAKGQAAHILKDFGILEYGIQEIDATEFNFPGC